VKEKIALEPARWKTFLFLALLIPVVAGKLAAAEDESGVDSTLVIDVYSGAVAPDATQEKGFWLWLESLERGEEPGCGVAMLVMIVLACFGRLSLPSAAVKS